MFDLQAIEPILGLFSLQKWGLNVLDLIIIAVLLFYILEGFMQGFVSALFDLISFILSFIFAVKFYGFIGGIISGNTSVPLAFSNAIGFFVVATIAEIILNILLKRLFSYFSSFVKLTGPAILLKRINHFLGIFPGALSALVLLSFFLTLIVALPLSPILKKTVSSSKIGSAMVSRTTVFEKSLNNVFGGAVNEALNFLTVEPKSDEFVTLKFKTSNVSPDPAAEMEMLRLVNKERTSRGLSALAFDNSLGKVARAHSTDMFKRGYFSHFTPEKLSPFDRMAEANIQFQAAGENLALAPSVSLAMEGLMNSPGHRANILSKDFGKIGIGAIDGGIYGIMFTQNFRD